MSIENMIIGKVLLDLSYYGGEDLYSDGEVEDEILELVKNTPPEEYETKVHENPTWPYIYHLSELRQNLVEWIPMTKDMKVLEIGSGCGAITGALADKCGHVTCIELSKKRSMINAYRNRDRDNIDILVGNFQTLESHLEDRYDLITLIGVLEYASSYIEGEDPYRDFIKTIKKHLKPEGRIIIAIENRFGLKYFEGAREDHTGRFFDGLEGYPESKGVRTFSKPELEKMAEDAGFKDRTFFYPYPDYKLPLMIFSDNRLPKAGELRSNIRNYDSEKMSLFDQGAVFDGIIESGQFDFFSNSYVCILSENEGKIKDYPLFVKYNARVPAHNLKTYMALEEGRKVVKKAPRVEAASFQIDRIKNSYNLLTGAYDDDILSINKFTESEGTLSFDFLEGRTFEEVVDEAFENEGYAGVLKEVKRYIEVIKGREGCVPFHKTEEFIKVFGNIDLYGDIDALNVANVDMIFGNIIINDKWNLIDYEWTFDFPVPIGYIIYRALMVYINFTPARRKLYQQGIFADLGITEREMTAYRSMDAHFYDYALGADNEYVSVLKSRVDMKAAFNEVLSKNFAKVYFDRGSGFNEKDTRLFPRIEDMCGSVIEFDIPKDVVSIRIDPVEEPCIISNILALTETGYSLDFSLNGRDIGEGRWMFDADPQIIFSCVTGHFKLYMAIFHHGKDIFKILNDTAREKDAQVNRYNELVTAVNNKGSIPRRVARKIKRSILGVFDRPGQSSAEETGTAGGIRKFNFAVVVDASRIEEEKLKFTMYSLACQTYRPYDIRFFGGSCEPEEVILSMNDYIKSSNADYYVLLKCGDALSNDALFILNEYANNYRPSAIFTDEKRFNLSVGDSHVTIFKPDFAIDTLRSSNYIGRFGVFESSFLEETDGLNESLHDEYIYDLFLKAAERDDVGHVQEILHYARVDSFVNFEEEYEALCDHVKRAGLPGEYVTTEYPGVYRPKMEVLGKPLVSIIIPNKDGADLLKKCIDSIERLSTYRNFEIIIIENNSITNEIFDYYEELKGRDNIRIETWTRGWNYSAINNFGISLAKGEYLLLLNNDIEIITPTWIEEMLIFAQRPDVGAVGAKLFYPTGELQHAGVIVGVRGVAGHCFHGAPGDVPGYMNRAVSVQNLSAVTAACMMVKKKAFLEAGSFNEGYAVAFNDVDLCLRIRKAGYNIVYTPYCQCYHHESVTRGADTESEDKMRRFAGEVHMFNQDWGGFLAKGDPYYNRNLSLDTDNFDEAEYKGI